MIKNVLIQAVYAGGKIMQEYFNKEYIVTNKEGINNIVTEADLFAEKKIIEIINMHYSDHQILCEEEGSIVQNSEYKWIIDPIDGTVNFSHKIPLCCVSIGLEKDGIMIMGAVYNPFLNELFFAEKNEGAFLNDKKISVSSVHLIEKSCIVTGFPYVYNVEEHNGPMEIFERIVKKGISVRRLGSAALDLCWVAAGRFDGFYENKLHPWDSAAGFLIVEEAGGTVTNFNGLPYSIYKPSIVATNSLIHAQLLEFIQLKK